MVVEVELVAPRITAVVDEVELVCPVVLDEVKRGCNGRELVVLMVELAELVVELTVVLTVELEVDPVLEVEVEEIEVVTEVDEVVTCGTDDVTVVDEVEAKLFGRQVPTAWTPDRSHTYPSQQALAPLELQGLPKQPASTVVVVLEK